MKCYSQESASVQSRKSLPKFRNLPKLTRCSVSPAGAASRDPSEFVKKELVTFLNAAVQIPSTKRKDELPTESIDVRPAKKVNIQ